MARIVELNLPVNGRVPNSFGMVTLSLENIFCTLVCKGGSYDMLDVGSKVSYDSGLQFAEFRKYGTASSLKKIINKLGDGLSVTGFDFLSFTEKSCKVVFLAESASQTMYVFDLKFSRGPTVGQPCPWDALHRLACVLEGGLLPHTPVRDVVLNSEGPFGIVVMILEGIPPNYKIRSNLGDFKNLIGGYVNDDYASESVNDLEKMKTLIDKVGSDLTVESFKNISIRDGNCHVEFDAADD